MAAKSAKLAKVAKLLKKITWALRRMSPDSAVIAKGKNALKKARKKKKPKIETKKRVPDVDKPKHVDKVDDTPKKGYGDDTDKVGPKTTSDGQVRNISTGGLRNEVPLTKSQKSEISSYAKSLGVDDDIIVFSDNMNTGYADLFGRETLYVGTDVLPSTKTGLKANSYVSMKGTLGHEIVGHRAAALAGKTQSVGYLEEAQASIRAARFTPDLSNTERMTLLRDGIGRLKDNGISIRDVKDQLWIKEP